jgi:hypothetical protein
VALHSLDLVLDGFDMVVMLVLATDRGLEVTKPLTE